MKFETLAVHAGYSPDPTTKAVAVPIYQTTAYAFDDTQHGADLFDLKVAGNIYTRIMNPTTAVLEQRIAALEGGIGALGVASGMAAISYAIQTIAESGDNIVSSATLYGGTYNLFAHTFPQLGIQARFADAARPESFEALIDERTKAIFCETIGNPLGNVTDFAPLAEIAHRHGVPLIVDNTVPSPYLCRPFEHGADIVVHSLTKYLGGHGNSIGGAIVDSGKFPWAQHKARFRRLNEPDVSYHGVVYTEALGAAAYIGRARVVPLRNMGAALSPFNAFLILQGIETVALRMDRICDNTLAVAQHLRAHPKVKWVNYAGLPDHADHGLVERYMGGRASGILTFGVEGGREGGARFQDALKLVTRLVNIGDAKSLACHPASTTHRQLAPEELAKAGVTVDTVRLAIGIEHIDDLRADLDQALAAVQFSGAAPRFDASQLREGRAMTLSLKPMTTTLIGGVVFLLPLIVVLTVVGKGLALMAGVAQPVAAMFPERQVGGVALVSLVALLLLLLLCYGAGLLARAALGRALSASFEDRLQALYPRYTVIKGMTQALGVDGVKSDLKTVLVSFDDHQVLAVEVERVADGRVVVFLPGAPDPWSGSVAIVSPERVERVPVDIGALHRSLKSVGRGSAQLLNAAG